MTKTVTMGEIVGVINNMPQTYIVAQDGNVLVFKYDGIPITVALTDEAIPRLRFSTNVFTFDNDEDDDKTAAVLWRLLEINREIDPVAAATETEKDQTTVQARTTLRVVDLQPEEVVSEILGFVNALTHIKEVYQSIMAIEISA